MKAWIMTLAIMLASAVHAVEPVKVKMLSSLSPGDELVVNAPSRNYVKGDALSLVDLVPGPEVVHARVVERLGSTKLKVRVVEEES